MEHQDTKQLAKVKRDREKAEKNMKRLHIMPPIIALLIYLLVFLILLATLVFSYVIILIASKTGDTFAAMDSFGKAVGYGSKDISAIDQSGFEEILAESGIDMDTPVCLIDEEGKLIFQTDKNMQPGNVSVLSNHTGRGSDERFSIGVSPSEVMEKGAAAISLFDLSDFSSMQTFSEWLNVSESEIDSWIYEALGDYTLAVNKPIRILNKDILTLFVIAVISLLMAIIPTSFYITSSIDRVASWRRLVRVYYYDTVTMNKNWLYFVERSGKLLRRGRRKKRGLAMVCIHFDKYQNYCTTHGTEEGELMLLKISDHLGKRLDKHKEVYARSYNGVFGLLINMADRESAEARVRNIVSELMNLGDCAHVSFTTGMCEVVYDSKLISGNDNPSEQWFNCAEIARSAADPVSGDLVWFNEGMKEERLWEHHIETRQEEALKNDEFEVYVQPKHSPVTGEMTGGEALIRWNSPVDGFLTPGRFIPIFEKNNFIIKIDEYMIRSLARLEAEWLRAGKKLVPISVNVSRVHFADPELAEKICSWVDEYRVPHEMIEIEVTESAFFDDKEALLSTVRKLKDAGFELSMDDFGTGYSSMNSLRQLPLDVLKLDASFFSDDVDTMRCKTVVEDTIKLAKDLNMKTVAEGIEEKKQVEILASMNCDMIQGYYFAKPMPAAEFAERLAVSAK